MLGMADLAGTSRHLTVLNGVQLRNFVAADYPQLFSTMDLAGTLLRRVIWNFMRLRNFVALDYLERCAADYVDPWLLGTADFLGWLFGTSYNWLFSSAFLWYSCIWADPLELCAAGHWNPRLFSTADFWSHDRLAQLTFGFVIVWYCRPFHWPFRHVILREFLNCKISLQLAVGTFVLLIIWVILLDYQKSCKIWYRTEGYGSPELSGGCQRPTIAEICVGLQGLRIDLQRPDKYRHLHRPAKTGNGPGRAALLLSWPYGAYDYGV